MTHEEMLLKEYELGQNKALELEKTIWQTFGVMGVGSVAAPVLVALVKVQGQLTPLIILFIGGLITYASFIWWGIARRWWSIQHVTYIRMHHIEEELGLYQNRYINYVDGYRAYVEQQKKRVQGPVPKDLEGVRKHRLTELKERSKKLDDVLMLPGPAHVRKGPQKFLQCLPYVNAIIWTFYIAAYWIANNFLPCLICFLTP